VRSYRLPDVSGVTPTALTRLSDGYGSSEQAAQGRKCSVESPIDRALILGDHGLFHWVLKQHSLKVSTERSLRL
jgi:hypothetical protein